MTLAPCPGVCTFSTRQGVSKPSVCGHRQSPSLHASGEGAGGGGFLTARGQAPHLSQERGFLLLAGLEVGGWASGMSGQGEVGGWVQMWTWAAPLSGFTEQSEAPAKEALVRRLTASLSLPFEVTMSLPGAPRTPGLSCRDWKGSQQPEGQDRHRVVRALQLDILPAGVLSG